MFITKTNTMHTIQYLIKVFNTSIIKFVRIKKIIYTSEYRERYLIVDIKIICTRTNIFRNMKYVIQFELLLIRKRSVKHF